MITAAQLRAARGLIDWTRNELAKAANISPETVKNIEHGIFRPQEETSEKILNAFAMHNVEFLEDEGVRKSKQLVKIFLGKQGFEDYLKHVYGVIKNGGTTTRHFNFSDTNLSMLGPEILEMHNERMAKIPGLDAKCLVPYGDRNFPARYCQYRWLKKEYAASIPYYVYGDFVLFFMQSKPDFMIVSIHSESLVSDLKKQFDRYWDDSVVPK